MSGRTSEIDVAERDDQTIVVRRGPAWGRILAIGSLGLLVLLIVAVAIVWIQRRPIATEFLEREFERRGVQGTYRLDRVGLRTQQVSNLVIGDPRRPDLVARRAIIQMRLKWDGSFEVYRVYARGVRLRGRLVRGRITWGQIDRLLPPPTDKPFALPNFALDVADASIALSTPFGPLGVALQGNGKLSGGFKGRVAVASPRLAPGRCAAMGLHANLAVAVVARRPQVEGPLALGRFACPTSRFDVAAPRFDAQASFNESFTSVDGRGRMAIQTLNAGENGLAAFVGDLTYTGSLERVNGEVKLAAQQSRLGTIGAERTRLQGRYHLGLSDGTFSMAGNFAADSARLDPSMFAGVTQPLAAAAQTPLGPIATAIANAIRRTAANFNIGGDIRVVNFPGGGAARITDADIRGPNGARARVAGGTGVTYYWPAYALRIDGNIEMAGGGLPTGRVALRQPRPGAPMSGVAELAPYTAGGARLALAPIRFGPGPGGSTAVATVAQLDGPFPNGRVSALRLPIEGRIGQGGSFAFGTACAVVSWNSFKMAAVELGPTRLPICPMGPAIVSKSVGGAVQYGARLNRPVLNGRLGQTPLHLAAANGQLVGQRFGFNQMSMRLGRSASSIVFDAARLTGSFAGGGTGGDFSGARATIGTVPVLLSEAAGTWRVHRGGLTLGGRSMVSDRGPDQRFYPLRTNDLKLTVAGDFVRASGTLRHPASDTLVTDVSIEHRLSNGSGHALLDVPGLTFGPRLQPEELTRLTEGVIAVVSGTVTGRGRIDWTQGGKVTSSGDFSTANMDLAAPFGPVTGLSTNIHFTDLLGLTTSPGQVATVRSINPGILVENGAIRYQLLPNQLVRVERGEWPFMGGRLILRETVLNFSRPSAKRLTFEVVGFDAKRFVDTLGFTGLEITGTFDGVLPMIFDEEGGRLVGGRLESRQPGGRFHYTGTRPNAGLMVGAAFDLLSDLRFRHMVIRLEGDLAGEFATRFTIEQITLGQDGGFVSGIVRNAFRNVPLRVNLSITGPFRALIQMAKGFKDPSTVIAPVLPFPLDAPGVVTETRILRKEEEQTRTSPPQDEVDVSTKPPPESE